MTCKDQASYGSLLPCTISIWMCKVTKSPERKCTSVFGTSTVSFAPLQLLSPPLHFCSRYQPRGTRTTGLVQSGNEHLHLVLAPLHLVLFISSLLIELRGQYREHKWILEMTIIRFTRVDVFVMFLTIHSVQFVTTHTILLARANDCSCMPKCNFVSIL